MLDSNGKEVSSGFYSSSRGIFYLDVNCRDAKVIPYLSQKKEFEVSDLKEFCGTLGRIEDPRAVADFVGNHERVLVHYRLG